MKQQHTLQPKLRFPEFDGDWKKEFIKNISDFIGGGTPDTSKSEFWQGNIPWISSSDIFENEILKISVSRFINLDALNNSATKLIPKGSLLIVSRVGVGKFAIAPTDICTSQDFTNLILKEDEVNNSFLAYQLFSNKNVLLKISQGTSIKGFTSSDLKSVLVLLPSLPEQQKIADYLSTVDNKINLLEEKKAQLALYKKAMMQKLFAQEIRFKPSEAEALEAYPEWEEKRLGEVFNSYNGLTGKTKENFGFGKPYIKYTQVFNNSKIDIQNFDFVEINDDDNQNSVEFGDAFFTVSSETPHEVGMSSVLLDKVNDVYLNSFCFGIRPKSKNLNPLYYRYFFRSKNFRKEVVKLAQGSTRYNMSKVEFMKIIIQIPSLPEQQKIADFLSAIDESIEKVTEQINQTQSFKKAMLQQMFV